MQTQQNKRAHLGEVLRQYLLSRRPTLASADLQGSVRGILLAGAAYVLSRAPLLFSVNPLPLALLCATDGQVGGILVGILLGLWQSGEKTAWWYVGGAIAILLLRVVARLFFTPSRAGDRFTPQQLRQLYFTHRLAQLKRLCYQGGGTTSEQDAPRPCTVPPPLFDEPVALRVIVSLIGGVLVCFGSCAAGGFAFYDLYGAVFYLLLTPAATALFAFSLSAKPLDAPPIYASVWRLFGLGALLASVNLCGRDLTFLSIFPVVVLSVAFCLTAVRQHGLGAGIFIALVCGIAYDALIIPMYVCLVAAYAFLSPAVGRFALLPATLGALIYLLVCGDDTALLALAPSLAVGVLLDTVIVRLHGYWKRVSESMAQEAPKTIPQDRTLQQLLAEQQHHRQLVEQISTISGAFSHLSEVFRQLCDQPIQRRTSDMRRLCEQSLEGICADCTGYSKCYDNDSLPVLNTLHTMCRSLQNEGKISEDCLDEDLRARCPHSKIIVSDVNSRISRLNYEALHSAQGEQFAFCCDEIAHLLRDIVHKDCHDQDESNRTASDAIAQYLIQHAIPARQVCVSGQDKKQLRILGITPAALTLTQEQLREDIGKILQAPVSKLHYDGTDDGTLSLCTLPRWRVDYMHRALAAEKKKADAKKRTACGDTLRVFEARDGIFCALLCDGMGNGPQAAGISGICGVFLERVLRAGVGTTTALRMLNHYLLSRTQGPEDEISSTVDLFMLNLYTGQGQFVKSGAAPSLILRDDRLFRLSSHTLPIGILHAVDVQIIPFEVQPGDHILLMSDGISDSEEGHPGDSWLSDALQHRQGEEDGALLDRLFSQARAHGSRDDMSVISIRVSCESK